MKVDLRVSTRISNSIRARQLQGMFDVPDAEEQEREWHGEVPLEQKDWNVGLIVGPSGAGKSSIAREMFGKEHVPKWGADSVIDDFDKRFLVKDIANACEAVGFNTIPAWLRPYKVLSTGEKFRVDLARRMIEADQSKPLLVDEFTSVVDRQVAKIGAHAVQKWVRRENRRFVAVSCHYDIIDWLRPDWVLEPATMSFRWESLLQRGRPEVSGTIERVPRTAWELFAPFHYLTAHMHVAARCYVLFVDDTPASFCGVLNRPHPTVKNILALSRSVTLPDWQGLGLTFVLSDALGAAYKKRGYKLRSYPAHPAFIRARDKSPNWKMIQAPSAGLGKTKGKSAGEAFDHWKVGVRPNAVFEYVGPTGSDGFLDGDERFTSRDRNRPRTLPRQVSDP